MLAADNNKRSVFSLAPESHIVFAMAPCFLCLCLSFFDPNVWLLHPLGVPAFVNRFVLKWHPIWQQWSRAMCSSFCRRESRRLIFITQLL